MKTHPLLGWHAVHYGVKGFRKDGSAFLQDSPLGVRLAVQTAQCSPPLLLPDRPWEEGSLGHYRMANEDGKLRLWYCGGKYLCYAESADGIGWEKPSLREIEFDGSPANNIAFARGWPCVCWFEDSGADPQGRFKAMGLEACWIDGEGKEVAEETVRDAMTHRTGNDSENQSGFSIRSSMAGYTSPDRFHWTRLDVPSLMDLFSDTQAVLQYDPQRGLYRGYFRTLWAGQRAIGYAETDDFLRWPLPKVVFHALPQDGPDADVYTNCYVPYPGRPDLHLMFPAIYRHTPDTIDISLAVSLDGMDWTRPGFDSIIPLGDIEGAPEQCLYASPDLVALPDGDWGLLYLSSSRFHNDGGQAARPGRYECCYRMARWRPHRLVGVAADGSGEFTVRPQLCHGGELRINYRTEPGGWVRVELADRTGGYPPLEVPPLVGHTFGVCDPLDGDSISRTVTWMGRSNLASLAGRHIAVRIRMSRATVFAVEM